MTLPAPTESRTDAGTLIVLFTTAVRAVPVGPFDVLPEFDLALEFAFTSTKATTMAITTTTAPDARNTRLRISVRLAAARWAAILSRADPSLLVLLALPMACLPGFLTAGGCSRRPARRCVPRGRASKQGQRQPAGTAIRRPW